MTEEEIRKQYQKDIPIFQAWGEYVAEKITNEISKEKDINVFLKIPPQEPRIKAMDSLIAKALHRQKNYSSPYDDITDKVGIRFVVLLTKDIKFITNIIENCTDRYWNASRDKDFEEERNKNPEQFTYESVHYVIYSLKEVQYNDITIPPNTPCEIQIRTLMQHAYAEMSHDTVYKPKVSSNANVKRFLARSMALVESADCFFISALDEITKCSQAHTELANLCLNFYPMEFKNQFDENVNNVMIDQLSSLLDGVSHSDISTWLKQEQAFTDLLIKRRYNNSTLCRQPAILLIYFLLSTQPILLQDKWPWTDEQLQPLLSDMGISDLRYGRY